MECINKLRTCPSIDDIKVIWMWISISILSFILIYKINLRQRHLLRTNGYAFLKPAQRRLFYAPMIDAGVILITDIQTKTSNHHFWS